MSYRNSHLQVDSIIKHSYRGTYLSRAPETISSKNYDWNNVQSAVVGLFQKKKIKDMHLATLHENVQNLLSSKIGPFMYDYYQKQLLTRGMIILRESIRRDEGNQLLQSLGEVWDYFYIEILPYLEAILYPIQTSDQELSIRKISLVGFRDVIVLKINLADALNTPKVVVPDSCKQMLLVTQSVRDTALPNENFLKLEALVARVIVPYLGYQGIYMGTSTPVVYALYFKPLPKEEDDQQSSGQTLDVFPSRTFSFSSRNSSIGSYLHTLFESEDLSSKSLECEVKE